MLDLTVRELEFDDPAIPSIWEGLEAPARPVSPHSSAVMLHSLTSPSFGGEQPAALVAERHGVTVGLLPIGRWKDQRGLRVLGCLGASWMSPDGLDVLAAPTDRNSVARAIHGHLAADRQWDILTFQGVGVRSALHEQFDGVYRGLTLRALPERSNPSPTLPVTGTDLRSVVPSRNLRRDARRAQQAAQDAGGGFSIERSPDEVAARYDRLVQLHRSQFPLSPLFGDQDRIDTVRRFFVAMARRDRLRLFVLAGAAREACMLLVLLSGTTALFYCAGTDRQVLDASPLPATIALGAAELAAEGIRTIDLGRGDTNLKRRFATDVREDVIRRVIRLGPRVGLVAAKKALQTRRPSIPGTSPDPTPNPSRVDHAG